MVADGEEENRKLCSHAWLYLPRRWFGMVLSDAGLLIAVGDRVSFITAKGTVFEADRNEIKVKWPLSMLGIAIYLTVDDKLYRLGLARPEGAEIFGEEKESLPKAAFDALTDTFDVLTGYDWKDLIVIPHDIYRARASAKAWKAYFGAETTATAPEEHGTAPGEQE